MNFFKGVGIPTKAAEQQAAARAEPQQQLQSYDSIIKFNFKTYGLCRYDFAIPTIDDVVDRNPRFYESFSDPVTSRSGAIFTFGYTMEKLSRDFSGAMHGAQGEELGELAVNFVADRVRLNRGFREMAAHLGMRPLDISAAFGGLNTDRIGILAMLLHNAVGQEGYNVYVGAGRLYRDPSQKVPEYHNFTVLGRQGVAGHYLLDVATRTVAFQDNKYGRVALNGGSELRTGESVVILKPIRRK